MGGRLEAERQHLGIGGRDVAPAERFDAGLEEFAFAVGAMAEHLAEIAEAFRLAGGRRREIVARHRDGEVGAQTKLAAGRVGRKIHAPANVLAREVEERFGRLEQRGLGAAIARALVMGDEGLRPSIRPKLRCALCLAHDVTYAALLAHDQFRKPVFTRGSSPRASFSGSCSGRSRRRRISPPPAAVAPREIPARFFGQRLRYKIEP